MQKHKIKLIIVIVSGLLAVTSASAYYYKATKKESWERPVEKKAITLQIAFHKEDLGNCNVTQTVTRTVPYTLRVADAALRELFKGPSAEERALGLGSTFNPSASLATVFTEGDVQPLATYYRGVSIKNKTAIVDFSREALAYLNSPACLQATVKSPIIDTLLQFPTIERVDFSIDGEVYTEWDA